MGGASTLAQNEADVLRFSYTQPLGSVRTMGMGGAYGALGADLGSAGIKLEDGEDLEPPVEAEPAEKKETNKGDLSKLTIKELEAQLEGAVENEDYELASKLRDEINRRTS